MKVLEVLPNGWQKIVWFDGEIGYYDSGKRQAMPVDEEDYLREKRKLILDKL